MVGAPAQPPLRGVDSRLLTLVTARVTRDIAAALAGDDLAVEQWTVLDYLDASGPCTMTALASATGTNGATLTRIVDRLVTGALVYRNVDSGDRRRVLVHLSERGRATVSEVRPRVRAAEQRATAELTEAERGELTRMLQRLSDPSPGG